MADKFLQRQRWVTARFQLKKSQINILNSGFIDESGVIAVSLGNDPHTLTIVDALSIGCVKRHQHKKGVQYKYFLLDLSELFKMSSKLQVVLCVLALLHISIVSIVLLYNSQMHRQTWTADIIKDSNENRRKPDAQKGSDHKSESEPLDDTEIWI